MNEETIASIVHQTKFCLTVPKMSELEKFTSPEFLIGGIPWTIQVEKSDDESSLDVTLVCAQSGDVPGWECAAYFSLKLLSFDDDEGDLEKCFSTPMVFDIVSNKCSVDWDWDDVVNVENNHLQDDKICMEIEVNVADPNELGRSKMTVETSQQCCNNSDSATFLFRVTNVKNLMAVQSPEITLQGSTWSLTVYKDNESNLGLYLDPRLSANDVKDETYDIEMMSKLITLKESSKTQFTKTCEEKAFNYNDSSCSVHCDELISWTELFKPGNGFIKDGSMTLQVKIKISKAEDSERVSTNQPSPNCQQIGCPICLQNFGDQNISCAPCGHTFCSDCIEMAVRKKSVCPTCNDRIALTSLRRVFLTT